MAAPTPRRPPTDIFGNVTPLIEKGAIATSTGPWGAPAKNPDGTIMVDPNGNIIWGRPGSAETKSIDEVLAPYLADWNAKIADLQGGFQEKIANMQADYETQTAKMKADAERLRSRRVDEGVMKTRKTGTSGATTSRGGYGGYSGVGSGVGFNAGSLLGEGGKTLLGA